MLGRFSPDSNGVIAEICQQQKFPVIVRQSTREDS